MISIIVPLYNESENIGGLIENLEILKGDFEVIFVDGFSEDNTIESIPPKYKVLECYKGRANQMNYGAKHARGDILFFLHCDSRFFENIIPSIERSISISPFGCFKIKFISTKLIMKICGFMSNMRVKFRNIAFGDQGIFIKRELFDKIGGYKKLPLMEDYQLSMDIKSVGIKINQANGYIYTSDRRFKKHGYLWTMYQMQKLQYAYRKKKNIGKIDLIYKDE